MALYTIGEVALLCDVNPITLRAWQRRYGLVKPQRTEGGHRLFTDADIERIREIKRWVDTGVQVSKVQSLLNNEPDSERDGWRAQQEMVLQYLQSGNLQRLRLWMKERGHDYSAETLITHLLLPLRRRLQSQQPALLLMLSLLDGVLISYICSCLSSARKRNNREALVIGWNVQDTTRLWLEGWVASQQGWRVEVLAHSISNFRPEMFEGQTLLVWCGEAPTAAQQKQLLDWRESGHAIFPLGN